MRKHECTSGSNQCHSSYPRHADELGQTGGMLNVVVEHVRFVLPSAIPASNGFDRPIHDLGPAPSFAARKPCSTKALSMPPDRPRPGGATGSAASLSDNCARLDVLPQPFQQFRSGFHDNRGGPPFADNLGLDGQRKRNDLRINCRADRHIASACQFMNKRSNCTVHRRTLDRKRDTRFSIVKCADRHIDDAAIGQFHAAIGIGVWFSRAVLSQNCSDSFPFAVRQTFIDREFNWHSSERIGSSPRRCAKVARMQVKVEGHQNSDSPSRRNMFRQNPIPCNEGVVPSNAVCILDGASGAAMAKRRGPSRMGVCVGSRFERTGGMLNVFVEHGIRPPRDA